MFASESSSDRVTRPGEALLASSKQHFSFDCDCSPVLTDSETLAAGVGRVSGWVTPLPPPPFSLSVHDSRNGRTLERPLRGWKLPAN